MRRFKLFTVGLTAAMFVTLGAIPSVWADFNDGVEAYEAGDYKTAFNEWLPLAKNNDPAAMRNIGHMYRRGLGTAQDYAKAMTWYKRAATIGFDRAQANVAGMYLEGEGVEKDYAQAANWFARAAQQGHVVSQYNLALLLENGLGVERSDKRALGWFALAAKAGHPQAQKKAAELAARIKNQPDDGDTNASGGPLITSVETQELVPTAETKSSEVIQKAVIDEEQADETEVTQVAEGLAAQESVTQEEADKTAVTSEKGVQKKGFYEALKSLVVTQGRKTTDDASATAPAEKTVAATPAETVTEKKAPVPPVVPKVTPTPADKPVVAAVPVKPVEVAAIPAPVTAKPVKASPAVQAVPTGTGLSAAEKLEMADLAYTLKQYQQSLSIWAPLAEDGNAEAQYRLGALFNAGVALPVDRVRAYFWWDKAKSNGSREAAAALAKLEPSLTYLEKRQIDRVN